MVERAQTSHLPDPYHKEPLQQGITTLPIQKLGK